MAKHSSKRSRATNKAGQSSRFIEAARELGCDEDESAFDAKLTTIAKGKPLSMDEVKEIVAKRKRKKHMKNS